MLIEIDGLRVLTNPVWGTRASPARIVGPKRFQSVPVALRRCRRSTWWWPRTTIAITLAYPSVRELAKRGAPFVTSLGVGVHLELQGWQLKQVAIYSP